MKEGLIFYNVADRVTLPKTIQKDVNYFQPDQVTAIRDALEEEPLKWKTLVHLLLITGCRIGELLGLKWDDIDFEKNRLHICRSLCYLPKMGTIETTPKTAASDRHIVIPQETADLLKQYQAWQTMEHHRLNEYYVNRNYVFALDDGQPMGRNSVTSWLDKFSKRHGLPHLNPHAFRHTMASLLYFNGVDSVSISKRLGHSRVSTTCDIYAHIVQEADQKNADILAEVFLGRA
ncbi:MAG: site-specific integrase [Oscillospiraceae bacterium]|nr:site-specific integrase [Oscillospiraceae bacterium]